MAGKKERICQERYEFMLKWLSAPSSPKKERMRLHPGFEKRLETLLKSLRQEVSTLRSNTRTK